MKADTTKSSLAADCWQLVREDDLGNRYVVAVFNSKEKAAETMVRYESKGHKQTYWIEKVE